MLSVGAGVAGAGEPTNYSGGAIGTPAKPVLKDVRCSERCLEERTVTETGRAELGGKNLDGIETVKLGGQTMKLKKVAARTVEFVIPVGTESGKPVAIDESGEKERSPVKLQVREESAIDEVADFEVKRATVKREKTYFNSKRKSKVEYLFESDKPTDVRIEVLKGKKQKVVDSILQKNQKPFETHSASWNGLTKKGKVAKNGKYKFRVTQASGGAGAGAGFKYYNHIFPLRGKHSYGDGLGAGRGHQGQDVFAKCGTKIVAARGGRVQTKASHSAAGNYLVIDGAKTGVDYVYMHMESRGRPKEGSRVRTGEVIGYESDTGRATGCHLHFELWSGPGWYEGGSVMDPTKLMKRWDRWS